MKNETFIPTDEFISSLYEEFISNDDIISMSELRRRHGLGSKSGRKVQLAIYKKYGEESVKAICLSRCSKNRRSKITGNYRPTKETLEKRSESMKKTYGNRPDLQEKARNWGKSTKGRIQSDEEKLKRANSNRGKHRSDETRIKMSVAKKGRCLSEDHKKALMVPKSTYRKGYKLSDARKDQISMTTKQQWKDGIHTPTFRSKGQLEVENFVKSLGYTVKSEFLIEGHPYDFLIVEKNLLVEYNGTFWHRDPRFFTKEMTHKGNCLLNESTEDVWKRDRSKIDLAKRSGYDIVVIWQYDWENSTNKENFIKSILKHE